MLQTVYNLSLPDQPQVQLPEIQEARLSQAVYQHDMLVLRTLMPPRDSLRVKPNDPIGGTIRLGADVLPFNGYIHAVRPVDSASNDSKTVLLYAMGPSYLMKDARRRVWVQSTVSAVARQIATEYGFVSDVEDHPVVWEMLAQPGISDWSLLVRLAQRVGFVFFVSGMTLTFRSLDGGLEARRSTAAQFVYQDKIGSVTQRGTLQDFHPVLAENQAWDWGVKAKQVVDGVDPRTSAPFGSVNDGRSPTASRDVNTTGTFTHVNLGHVAHTKDQADAISEGSAALARFQHRGIATLLGNTRLRQADETYLRGLQGGYSGYWTVLSTEHRFQGPEYTLTAELGTDSLGAMTASREPTRTSPIRQVTATYDRYKRVWVASYLSPQTVVDTPGAQLYARRQ